MKKWIGLLAIAFIGVAYYANAQQMVGPAQVGIGCAYNSSPPAVSSGQSVWVQCDTQGKLLVNSTFSGSVTIVTPLAVNLASATTGGCTPGKTLSAASTNSTSVKGSVGTLCSLNVINTTPTVYYLKFYDKATAPTCNSDTVVQSLPVPANSSSLGGGVAAQLGPFGLAFTTGIGFCLTGAIADNDNTSAAAGVAISYGYK